MIEAQWRIYTSVNYAIIETNADMLINWTIGDEFQSNFIKIQHFLYTEMNLEILCEKLCPFCLYLNVLIKVLCLECIGSTNFWLTQIFVGI